MDVWKLHAITHRDHTFMNPTSSEKLDEMVGRLELEEGSRVLDIACGKADPLTRIAQRYHVEGVGVDFSPYFVRDARSAARTASPPSHIELLEMDGKQFTSQEPFDLAMCLGASWIYGGFAGTLEAMRQYTHPGGLILVGEPHWIKKPASEIMDQVVKEEGQFSTHMGNVKLGIEAGLLPLYCIVSSHDDWDRYQWLKFRAAETYALLNPEDPDVPELLTRVHRSRDSYLRYGRDCIGWAMYLFAR